jgi:hypothetical protein
MDRATTDTTYATTDTPLATTGAWRFLAFVFNQAGSAGNLASILSGDLATLAAVRTLSKTDGSGAFSADAAGNLIWGNTTAAVDAIEGDLAHVALFSALLSTADIQSWQRRPRKTVGANVALDFHRLGNEGGSTDQDYSGNGNTGTVTGTAQAAGPPLDESGLYVPSYAMAA